MMEEFWKEANLLETMACNMICTLPITFVTKPNQPRKFKGDVVDAWGALLIVTKENVMEDLITFEEKVIEELLKKTVLKKTQMIGQFNT